MKGFSVEPGERSVRVMSIQPERPASKKSAEPTSPRISPVMASAMTMATETRGPSLCAASRATASSPSCTLFTSVSRWAACAGWLRSAVSAACAASAGRARRVEDTCVERGAGGLALAEQAGRHHAAKHAVAGGVRGIGMAVGTARFGQLRQGDEQGGLRDGEALRLLAEPGERGGAHAFEIAAIGRQRQVGFQDVALGQAALDLDGAEHLAQLAGQAAAFARLDQAGELHRQRRAAGDDAAIARRTGRRRGPAPSASMPG